MKPRSVVLLVLLGLPLAGCVDAPGEAGAEVVATFYPLAFVAERLAADDARVVTFVPPGASPRSYEPSPRDLVRVADAKLVLYNGEGLEPWLDPLRAAAPDARFVAATRGVTFVDDEGFPEDAAKHASHGTERHDPHVWLDPLRMKRIVNETAAALVDIGLDAGLVEARAEALRDGLDALHVRYAEGLAKCETRHVFVTRPTLGYIVVRYNLYQHGFSNLHPEAEVTPRRMVAQVDLARELGADAIFQDAHGDPMLAQAFARALPGRVVPFDTLEGLTDAARRDGANYFSVMDANLARLRDGLRCG